VIERRVVKDSCGPGGWSSAQPTHGGGSIDGFVARIGICAP
jgi:hypothetical protein